VVKQPSKVPFGYEPDKENQGPRGTMWVYDSFQDYSSQQLLKVLHVAERKELKKLVFYPLHEETLKRMGIKEAEPFYHRAERLEELLEKSESEVNAVIDHWEGRRKKYTPMDTAFSFLEEKDTGPFFVYVTLDMANTIAAFEGFDSWIRKLRLCIDMGSHSSPVLHPKLQASAHRWDAV
jgi:hypothetical protein